MATKTSRERIDALLAKTQANGCTEGEEQAAVEKAVELIRAAGYPTADFKFPEGYNAAGVKIPPEVEVPKRPEIIKQTCERLLMEITGRDKDGFTTGHSYEEILRRVKLIHPHGNTSIKCLRWYATHMNQQGCAMPQKRDRPVPKRRAPANDAMAEPAEAA